MSTTVAIPLEWAKSMLDLLRMFAEAAKENPSLGFNEFYIENHAKVMEQFIEKAK